MGPCLRMVRVTRSPVSAAGRHLAGLRLAAALLAVLASGLLLALLCVSLGGWSSSLLVGWLAVVPALHTKVGEREAVAVGCRFRAPSRAVRAALDPVWHSACRAAGIAVTDVDLYLKRDGGINAYAAGRRSVAVTTGALTAFLSGSLPPRQMEALLLHELGHHAIGGLRYGLAVAWLAWPWRAARHLVLGLCWPIARRQPRGMLAVVVAGGVVIAIAQSVQHGHLAAAVVLTAVAVCAVACPTINAWASRRGELAADQFAVSCGAGPDLALLLARLEADDGARREAPRAIRRHPPTARRLFGLPVPPQRRSGLAEPTCTAPAVAVDYRAVSQQSSHPCPIR